MKSMFFWNLIVSALFSFLGAAIIFLSQSFVSNPGNGDPGSGVWPISLGIIMISLSVLLIIQGVVSRDIRGKVVSLMTEAHRTVYVVMGLSVLFCLFTYLLGFIASAFIFIYLLMNVLGVKSQKEKLITAGLIIFSLYLIFGVILKTSLPVPIFMR